MTTATESYSNIEKARDVILYVGIALLIITSFYIVVTDANCLIPPNDKILVCSPAYFMMEQWMNDSDEYKCYKV